MARICLLDGGTGRELLRIGAPFGQPEWSARALMDGPEFVTRVHEAFVAAGAQVLTTNSYALVPFHLGQARFDADGHRLAALAGRLAREVANRSPHPVAVAGCLPPLCGSYRTDLFDAHAARPILATLVDALAPTVDYWLAETLSAVAEAELVGQTLGASGKPLWLAFTIAEDMGSGAIPRLRSGERVIEAVAASMRLGAAAILFNCSRPEVMGAAVSAAAQVLRDHGDGSSLPIGVYANAFVSTERLMEANAGYTELRRDVSATVYLQWARDWVSRGARIVGGCCGIGPEHIAALRSLNAS